MEMNEDNDDDDEDNEGGEDGDKEEQDDAWASIPSSERLPVTRAAPDFEFLLEQSEVPIVSSWGLETQPPVFPK